MVSGPASYWHVLKVLTQRGLALRKAGTGSGKEAQEEGSKSRVFRSLSFECAVLSSGPLTVQSPQWPTLPGLFHQLGSSAPDEPFPLPLLSSNEDETTDSRT